MQGPRWRGPVSALVLGALLVIAGCGDQARAGGAPSGPVAAQAASVTPHSEASTAQTQTESPSLENPAPGPHTPADAGPPPSPKQGQAPPVQVPPAAPQPPPQEHAAEPRGAGPEPNTGSRPGGQPTGAAIADALGDTLETWEAEQAKRCPRASLRDCWTIVTVGAGTHACKASPAPGTIAPFGSTITITMTADSDACVALLDGRTTGGGDGNTADGTERDTEQRTGETGQTESGEGGQP